MADEFKDTFQQMIESKRLDEGIAERILKKILKILFSAKEKKKDGGEQK